MEIEQKLTSLRRQRSETQKILRAKYRLPSWEMSVLSPLEYLQRLTHLAAECGIQIRPAHERGLLFQKYPKANACCTGDSIYVKDSVSIPISQRIDDVEHELTHGIQDQRYPGMGFWRREYEAYIIQFHPKILSGEVVTKNGRSSNYVGSLIRGSVQIVQQIQHVHPYVVSQ